MKNNISPILILMLLLTSFCLAQANQSDGQTSPVLSGDHRRNQLLERYPFKEKKNATEPQDVLTSLSLRKLFPDNDFKTTPTKYNLNSLSCLRYFLTKGKEKLWIDVYLCTCSKDAYESAINLVVERMFPYDQIDRSDPFFIGDWCIGTKFDPTIKDFIPIRSVFIMNNILVDAYCALSFNVQDFWKSLRTLETHITEHSRFVKYPEAIHWGGITDTVDVIQEVKKSSWSEQLRAQNINEAKKTYEYAHWRAEWLSPRGPVLLPASCFAPLTISNILTVSDNHILVSFTDDRQTKARGRNAEFWIYSSVQDAEDTFLVYLKEWNVPSNLIRLKGPGRISFCADNADGIAVLVSNIIFILEGPGINHITLANNIVKAIRRVPELQPDVVPSINVETNKYEIQVAGSLTSTSGNIKESALLIANPPHWRTNTKSLIEAARQIGDAAIEGTITLDETQQKNLNKHLDEVIASFGLSNSNEREEANLQIQRLWRLTVPKLIENIGNKNISISEAAVKNLILMRNEKIIKEIIEKVNTSTDSHTRQAGIFTLGMMKQQRSSLIPNRTCLDESSSDELARTHIIPFLTKLKETEKDPSTQKIIQNALNYLEHPINSRAKPDKK